jgi:ribose transport system ATP-binding protein
MKTTAAQPSATAGGPLLEAVALSKSFGPVEVLKDVSLAVNPGEVHAIIGENGAGKSTLMKLLAGHLQPTRGELRIDGKTADGTARRGAARHRPGSPGNPFAPDLTVVQNVYLGQELPKGMVVDDRAMNEGARQAVRNLGADIDPDVVVRRLSIAQAGWVFA